MLNGGIPGSVHIDSDVGGHLAGTPESSGLFLPYFNPQEACRRQAPPPQRGPTPWACVDLASVNSIGQRSIRRAICGQAESAGAMTRVTAVRSPACGVTG